MSAAAPTVIRTKNFVADAAAVILDADYRIRGLRDSKLLTGPEREVAARVSPALLRRAHEMKMDYIYMKIPLKMPAYEEILAKAGLKDSEVAYVGDDLPDIPILKRVGLAVAVGDAVADVRKIAHYTTKAHAGKGAIREAIELILKSKGIWDELIDKARA